MAAILEAMCSHRGIVMQVWYRRNLRLYAEALQGDSRRTENLFQGSIEFKSRRLRLYEAWPSSPRDSLRSVLRMVNGIVLTRIPRSDLAADSPLSFPRGSALFMRACRLRYLVGDKNIGTPLGLISI